MNNKSLRRISNSLLALVALFEFFSVLIDAGHIVFIKSGIHAILGIIEEGREILVMSVITWYLIYLDPDSAETIKDSKFL